MPVEGRDLSSRRTQHVVRDLEIRQPINSEECSETAEGVARESEGGSRLLTRTTRSVTPTPAGEQLLSTLRPALDEIEAQLNALSELREVPSGSLRLTAGQHAAQTVLWPALLRLNAGSPDIKVEVAIEPPLIDIVTGQYDPGVRV